MNVWKIMLSLSLCYGFGQCLAWWIRILYVQALKRYPRFWQGRYSIFCAGWLGLLTLLVVVFGKRTWGPSFGLSLLCLAPLAIALISRLVRGSHSRQMDTSAVACLHAVRGLVKAGISLPSALFQVARSLRHPFADALAHQLRSFDEGRPLDHCLERFRKKNELEFTGLTLRILEVAYRQGLPVLPVLDRVLPLLEQEQEQDAKRLALCRSAIGQGLMACLLPWAVIGFLAKLQPDVAQAAFGNTAFWVGVGGCLFWQSIGMWTIWKKSQYC